VGLLIRVVQERGLRNGESIVKGILRMRIKSWIALLITLTLNLMTMDLSLDFEDLEDFLPSAPGTVEVDERAPLLYLANLHMLRIN
jgi:hypothetical protein